MNVDYSNMPFGMKRGRYVINYFLNKARTFILCHIKFHNIEYHGFVRIMGGCRFNPSYHMVLGNNVQFGNGCLVDAPLEVGDFVLVASRVAVIGRKDHDYQEPGRTIWEGEHRKAESVIIEDDVWIGYGSIILSGVRIGKGSVVAAGSVVTKDVEPYTVVGGNPARFLKQRYA